jgi:hypothetical protein
MGNAGAGQRGCHDNGYRETGTRHPEMTKGEASMLSVW